MSPSEDRIVGKPFESFLVVRELVLTVVEQAEALMIRFEQLVKQGHQVMLWMLGYLWKASGREEKFCFVCVSKSELRPK